MKRILLSLLVFFFFTGANAVLKEQDLEQTLSVLSAELTEYHQELISQAEFRKQQTRDIISQLQEAMKRSSQNSLMLYSQQRGYVFDLTYACHEATQQYLDFQKKQLPFESFLANVSEDIAKYDSLTTSLKSLYSNSLSQKSIIDRAVCLTLATNIRNTLEENRAQVSDYITFHEMTEQRLKYLNDYANKRYSDIQQSIFKNGSENYFSIIKNIKSNVTEALSIVKDKYRSNKLESDWDSSVILRLFVLIAFYIIIAVLINMLAFKLMPKRFHTDEFLKKRSCIIMATTTITFAVIMAILRATIRQNFYIMASSLLIEYAWLLSVILISLLLRVKGNQIKSAFHIYSPLVLMGFIVITFRIILIPSELVNIIFPPPFFYFRCGNGVSSNVTTRIFHSQTFSTATSRKPFSLCLWYAHG